MEIDELIAMFLSFLKIGDIILRKPCRVAAVKPTTYWKDFRGQKLFRIQVK
jgi:hypothetical protein